jgi:flagellar hook protein FlgE
MSITNSLYIGISGLQAHGDAIGVVGDNIANTSTVGYKRNRAEFSDMLGGQLDGQRLRGVRLAGTQTMWDQGA